MRVKNTTEPWRVARINTGSIKDSWSDALVRISDSDSVKVLSFGENCNQKAIDNANLIAAAPAMLEAMKHVHAGMGISDEAAKILASAIAKAKGERG